VLLFFDSRVTGVVYDDTHQQLHGSCVKICQTAVALIKDSFRN